MTMNTGIIHHTTPRVFLKYSYKNKNQTVQVWHNFLTLLLHDRDVGAKKSPLRSWSKLKAKREYVGYQMLASGLYDSKNETKFSISHYISGRKQDINVRKRIHSNLMLSPALLRANLCNKCVTRKLVE